MDVSGLIFSNIHNSSIPELTAGRTMASVPFGCRYRLVDFPLSYMVHAGIRRIGVITHTSYQSLMDHIGTGKDWDLARRSGGIRLLPPFVSATASRKGERLYTTRLEALMGAVDYLEKGEEGDVVLADCDAICSPELGKVIRAHREKGAALTVVTRRVTAEETLTGEDWQILSEENGRVTRVLSCLPGQRAAEISANILVANRAALLEALREAGAYGYTDLYRDIVAGFASRGGCYRYLWEDVFLRISSLRGYYQASMRLLEPRIRAGLFREDRPILTKLRNSAPTRYGADACVRQSYVADGCIIEGRVENSILFRGVRIGKGTTVRNSIVMQDTVLGENVSLRCVITDKNVTVRDGRELSGHETAPFFLAKGSMV